MADVMYACIIMHSMIIEDNANANLLVLLAPSSSHNTLRRGFTFNDLQVITSNLQDSKSYCSLRDDLWIQHLWIKNVINNVFWNYCLNYLVFFFIYNVFGALLVFCRSSYYKFHMYDVWYFEHILIAHYMFIQYMCCKLDCKF